MCDLKLTAATEHSGLRLRHRWLAANPKRRDRLEKFLEMNVHQLYDTLRFIDHLDSELGIQPALEAVRDNLTNLTSQPAHAQHQSNLANALATFSDAVEKLPMRITPAQKARIADTGGDHYFSPSMDADVRASISTNAMTPSVARDYVAGLGKERARYLQSVTATHQGMHELGVQGETPQAGSAEMAFLIPRDMFK